MITQDVIFKIWHHKAKMFLYKHYGEDDPRYKEFDKITFHDSTAAAYSDIYKQTKDNIACKESLTYIKGIFENYLTEIKPEDTTVKDNKTNNNKKGEERMTKDDEDNMCKILKAIKDSRENNHVGFDMYFNAENLGIDKYDFHDAIELASEKGYIKGLSYTKMVNGTWLRTYSDNPRLGSAGKEFLELIGQKHNIKDSLKETSDSNKIKSVGTTVGNNTTDNSKKPKVFISYSWEVQERVIELAKRLFSDGVNVIIDIWNLKKGHDKYSFMEQCVTDSTIEKVLIICDKTYMEKANNREGGSGDETIIISPEVYGNTVQEKFIPIVFEVNQANEPYLPTYLKTIVYINLSDNDCYEKGYEELIRLFYNKPLHKKPALGNKPNWLNAN